MRSNLTRQIWVLIASFVLCVQSASAQRKVLNIPPVFQTTPVYCWLATGQMVFQYFGIPANGSQDYQCGEARGIGAVPTQIPSGQQSFVGPCWNNCHQPQCMRGSGTIHGIYNLIVQYPQIVARTSGNTKFFPHPSEATSSLSATDVMSEIDNGRPIIAGISPGVQFLPPGISEHAVLIIGYENGGNLLIVNDPFPYQATNMTPSYLQFGGHQITPGQFRVPYQSMVGQIAWRNTISNLQTNGNHQQTQEPQSNREPEPDSPLNCSIMSTSTPWNPPGTVRVKIDGRNVGSFQFGPNGSSSLDFNCTAGHHRFQFSVMGSVPSSCSGSFDVDSDNTDFSPTINVSPFGQVSCSLD